MPKNQCEALRMAGLANVTYEQHNLLDTLLLLNKSLSLADPNSNLPSCCYGKRAVVFFDLNEYDLCIADINLSIQTNKRDPLVTLPPFKAFTEYMRDKHHHPEADDDPTNFFQLSHPANPRLPCLADCLQLNTNEKYGRHIITTRALNVGDIVGVTDFSFIFFDKRARLHHCSHCTTSATKLRLIPCPNCDSAMYCSMECLTKDANQFHQFECGINGNPIDQHLDYNPLKIFVHILAEFDWNFDEMKAFLDANAQPKTVFDFDLSDKSDPNYAKNMILATLSMSHNMRCAEKARDHCLRWHHRFIMKHPKLSAIWRSGHKQYLDDLLCKFVDVEDVKGLICCLTQHNMNLREPNYEIIDAKTNGGGGKVGNFFANPIAFVNDPYMGLLNQSCFPNLTIKFVQNKHAWIVIRPIPAGGQLFMFRGPGNKYLTPRRERQKLMKDYYGFDCDCDGCKGNWPTQDKMRRLTEEERIKYIHQGMNLFFALNKSGPKAYLQYFRLATQLQIFSSPSCYPCWDAIFVEHTWLLNIYRLSLPAKWLHLPAVADDQSTNDSNDNDNDSESSPQPSASAHSTNDNDSESSPQPSTSASCK